MFKLDPEVNAALMELFEMVVDLNCRTPHDFFFELVGHCDAIRIGVHRNGWEKGSNARYLTFQLNLNDSPETVIKKLSKIAKEVKEYDSLSKRVRPLKLKKRKPLLVIHPRRVGRTAALKKLMEVQNG